MNKDVKSNYFSPKKVNKSQDYGNNLDFRAEYLKKVNVVLPEQVKNEDDFQKYLDSKTEDLKKSNYCSPKQEKKAQDYVDRIKKLYPDTNFEKNVVPSNGSEYRLSTFSYDM